MEYEVIATRDGDTWVVDVPDLPGCHTEVGPTDDFQRTVREAIDLWLADSLASREVPPKARSHHAPPESELRRVRPSSVLASRVLIRQARADAGINQAELAERIGVSQQQVAALESPDGDIKLGTLEKVADALGLHLVVSFAA